VSTDPSEPIDALFTTTSIFFSTSSISSTLFSVSSTTTFNEVSFFSSPIDMNLGSFYLTPEISSMTFSGYKTLALISISSSFSCT